jgi:hypothetical protein
MPIAYPSWWRGFRWEMERLLRDLFTYPNNQAAVELSGIRVERFLNTDDDVTSWLSAGNGILMVHRNGGSVNKAKQPWVDQSIVTLGALTTSPDESQKLMDYVAGVFDAFEEGGTVQRSVPHVSGLSTTFMKVPGEVVGPQLIPEPFRDERLVPTVWQIHTDIPRGLPDYRANLGLDH